MVAPGETRGTGRLLHRAAEHTLSQEKLGCNRGQGHARCNERLPPPLLTDSAAPAWRSARCV